MIDKIHGIRLFRSAIIVKHRDVNDVTDLLSEYNAEIVIKKVVVDKEEAEQLGIK